MFPRKPNQKLNASAHDRILNRLIEFTLFHHILLENKTPRIHKKSHDVLQKSTSCCYRDIICECYLSLSHPDPPWECDAVPREKKIKWFRLNNNKHVCGPWCRWWHGHISAQMQTNYIVMPSKDAGTTLKGCARQCMKGKSNSRFQISRKRKTSAHKKPRHSILGCCSCLRIWAIWKFDEAHRKAEFNCLRSSRGDFKTGIIYQEDYWKIF